MEGKVVRGKGKSGRHYETAIRDEYIELLSRFKDIYEDSIIAPIKADSADAYLHECLKKCGIDEKYTENKTGIHSIRKNVSQDLYDRKRMEGMDDIQASTIVSRNLSHGKYRIDVDRNYIKRHS